MKLWQRYGIVLVLGILILGFLYGGAYLMILTTTPGIPEKEMTAEEQKSVVFAQPDVLPSPKNLAERKKEAIALILAKYSRRVSDDDTRTHLLWRSEGAQITYQEKYDKFHIEVRDSPWEWHIQKAKEKLYKDFFAGYEDVACSLTNVEIFVLLPVMNRPRDNVQISLCEGQS